MPGRGAPPPYNEISEAPTTSDPTAVAVSIHPLPENDAAGGVIVKVTPPKIPADDKKASHVPCDITLVIDVSSSMNNRAPVPRDLDEPDKETDDHPVEDQGLSVLDLVKHSCRTILSSMDERDRLAIVTFSGSSNILQGLTFTTDANKEEAKEHIEKMSGKGVTNLWSAIKSGIDVFRDAEDVGNVPAIMVLTDGVPNHMCPVEGYVPALMKKQAKEAIVPAIHTFGFGYELKSGLLKSIAEFGGGNYAFIPDAGMIGTTFVHAVAHLQSTFATDASLFLNYPDHVVLEQTTGPYVEQKRAPGLVDGENFKLTIPLGSIQYGQSRDIYLRWSSQTHPRVVFSAPFLTAVLEYNFTRTTKVKSEASCSLHDISAAPTETEAAYHISRSQICAFLAGMYPILTQDQHRLDKQLDNRYGNDRPGFENKQQELAQLISSLPAARHPEDARCQSLLQDLNGGTPFGQVSIALSSREHFGKWGHHYLTSLHGAHARQLCGNFRDQGPLQYGTESPLFLRCREALDTAFNKLPPPVGSLGAKGGGNGWRAPGAPRPRDPQDVSDPSYRTGQEFSMASYNSSKTVCFAGQTMVALAGGKRIRMRSLRKGMAVATPLGPRRVAAVLVTPVKNQWMVDLAGVLVTPWHPVTLTTTTTDHLDVDASRRSHLDGWQFPFLLKNAEDEQQKMVQYNGCIYSVLLQRDADVDAHAILLGGTRDGSACQDDAAPFWGVTLGHGLVAGPDVRAHEFFGDYTRVLRSLAGLRARGDGCLLTGGVRRNKTSGLACGFKKYRKPVPAKTSPRSHGTSSLVRHKMKSLPGRQGAMCYRYC